MVVVVIEVVVVVQVVVVVVVEVVAVVVVEGSCGGSSGKVAYRPFLTKTSPASKQTYL